MLAVPLWATVRARRSLVKLRISAVVVADRRLRSTTERDRVFANGVVGD